MKQVTKNVYVETEYRGCNPGFVVTSEGVVMIDAPQRAPDAMQYRGEIEKRGRAMYLVNTEPHLDHYAGNCFFTAPCVAHQGTREIMEHMSSDQLRDTIRLIDPECGPDVDLYRVRLPMITFVKSMRLYAGNHSFELIHLPGHTASETAVYIPEERVVFTGDNIFYKLRTFLQEALPNEWLDSLESLKKLDVDYYIPGHGDVCTAEYLDEQASVIREWIAAVKEAIGNGWTLEEAQKRISFLDRHPMGQGMEAFGPELQRMNVARLYALAAKRKL